jgi:hypothetical protein
LSQKVKIVKMEFVSSCDIKILRISFSVLISFH